MKATLQFDQRIHQLGFSEATVHLQGEFGGNIDLTISATPKLPLQAVLDSLTLEIADEGVVLDVVGYREEADHIKLTFCSEHLRETQEAPKLVDAFWGAAKEVHLTAIPCAEAAREDVQVELEPVALAASSLDDPNVIRRGNVRGVLALIGLLLLLLATIYGLFPEVRALFR